jgi:hypothetical protein
VRTLVISDLHLGAHRGTDALRRPGPLAALQEAVSRADRLVLLGDALELRHGPVREALAAAEPVFAALGEALGPKEVVLVPGNHDHALVAPWLERRAEDGVPGPLGLEQRVGPDASRASSRLAAALGPARLDVAYPGVVLREDVYATHGHYLDRLITIPTFERVAAGGMARIVGPLPTDHADPDHFERALAPLYAWMEVVAQQGSWTASRQSASAKTWQLLTAEGPRPVRARALAALFPLAVRAVNRLGLGPISPNLSALELRRAGLRAMGEVVRLLGVRHRHVLFGHTHRAGPLPEDDPAEWIAPTGAQLHNPGAWVDEPIFTVGGSSSPYWGGRGLWLEDEGPPRLEPLAPDLGR